MRAEEGCSPSPGSTGFSPLWEAATGFSPSRESPRADSFSPRADSLSPREEARPPWEELWGEAMGE